MKYIFSVMLSIHNHIPIKFSVITFLLNIVQSVFYIYLYIQQDGLNIKSQLKEYFVLVGEHLICSKSGERELPYVANSPRKTIIKIC